MDDKLKGKSKGKAAWKNAPRPWIECSRRSAAFLRKGFETVRPDRTTSRSCRICGAWPVSRRAFLKGAAATSEKMPLAGCGEADIGWLARRLVSPEAEAELGRQAFQQIASEMPVTQDPRLHAYVRRIGERFGEASGSPYTEWVLTVFESEQANAFALPGGRVGMFTGMLKLAANEDQLAAVLGHEVGHVNARHGAERLEHFPNGLGGEAFSTIPACD